MNRLSRSFFARPTLVVARALLGQRLVRVFSNPRLGSPETVSQRLAGRIVELEAYTGADDAASHAYRGRTPRNAPMFGPPGQAYVYFIYGMHWMFNVVAHPERPPGAVLIRALLPEEGQAVMRELRGGRPDRDLASGPARLAQALAIDGSLSGVDLCTHSEIFIERGTIIPDAAIARGPRVGVRGDESARTRPWRFWIKSEA